MSPVTTFSYKSVYSVKIITTRNPCRESTTFLRRKKGRIDFSSRNRGPRPVTQVVRSTQRLEIIQYAIDGKERKVQSLQIENLVVMREISGVSLSNSHEKLFPDISRETGTV